MKKIIQSFDEFLNENVRPRGINRALPADHPSNTEPLEAVDLSKYLDSDEETEPEKCTTITIKVPKTTILGIQLALNKVGKDIMYNVLERDDSLIKSGMVDDIEWTIQ